MHRLHLLWTVVAWFSEVFIILTSYFFRFSFSSTVQELLFYEMKKTEVPQRQPMVHKADPLYQTVQSSKDNQIT